MPFIKKFIKNHLWQCEAGFVALVLILTVILTKNTLNEWVGACAVFFSFMHAQVADHLAEAQEKQATPTVGCWQFLSRYFWIKEILWFLYFILSQTYAALAGVCVFMLYKLWRKKYVLYIQNNWAS